MPGVCGSPEGCGDGLEFLGTLSPIGPALEAPSLGSGVQETGTVRFTGLGLVLSVFVTLALTQVKLTD